VQVYLDTSVIVSLFANDALNARALKFLNDEKPILFVSDFAAAEFAAAIARRVRTRELTDIGAREIFSRFDIWRLSATRTVLLAADDVRLAESFIRRLDMTLLAPDALHIAMAKRAGAALATFDTKMAASAKNLGLDLAGA